MCPPEISGFHSPRLILHLWITFCLGTSILQAIIPWPSTEPTKAHVTVWSNYWKAAGASQFKINHWEIPQCLYQTCFRHYTAKGEVGLTVFVHVKGDGFIFPF